MYVASPLNLLARDLIESRCTENDQCALRNLYAWAKRIEELMLNIFNSICWLCISIVWKFLYQDLLKMSNVLCETFMPERNVLNSLCWLCISIVWKFLYEDLLKMSNVLCEAFMPERNIFNSICWLCISIVSNFLYSLKWILYERTRVSWNLRTV